MSSLIVDASVGIKWFLPEVLATEARAWRNGLDELHVPERFFDIEIANILWKKVRGGDVTEPDAVQILAQLPKLPLTRHSELVLLPVAFDLAWRTQQTVYDCLYVALAVQVGGRMITADLKLYNALSSTAWGQHVIWVADIPTK